MKKRLLWIMLILMAAGCAKNEIEKKINDKEITLEKPKDVSASFESKEYTVKLSKDLTGIARANIHDYNSDFIREVKIQGDKIHSGWNKTTIRQEDTGRE